MQRDEIIVVDVGNTSTGLGVFSGLRRLLRTDMPTHSVTLAKAFAVLRKVARGRSIGGAVYASVVPKKNAVWLRALRQLCPGLRIIVVGAKTNLGVPVTYPKPHTIGADRLANACAAAYRWGAPVIVADFGTAVTFDVIEKKRGYIGGVIAPGVPLMFSYLAEKTALLPKIEPGEARHRVGQSTEEAMQLGARWGYRGLVREIFTELRRTPSLRHARLCATGGLARWVMKGSDLPVIIDPELTLLGLARIYQLNS